jgi:hypothetical protein
MTFSPTQFKATLLTAIANAIEDVIEDEISSIDDSIELHDLIDWQANCLEDSAVYITSLASDLLADHLEKQTEIVLETFAQTELPAIQDAYEQDGIVDGPARREGWSNYLDYLNRNGRLSDYAVANIDADVEAL